MSETPLKCMFDTVVFNRILDGQLSLASLGQHVVAYATHVQRDELQNTTDDVRRADLMQVFHEVVTEAVHTTSFVLDASKLDEAKLKERMVPTASMVWGTSKWGQAKWTDAAESLYPMLRSDLDRLEVKANNVQDALIADTAIRSGYVLITDDGNLATVTKHYGGVCHSVKELTQLLNSIRQGKEG